jgi:type III restriction enzyme
MQLKSYQVEALDTLSGYLKLLSNAKAEAEQATAAIAALPENMRAHIPAPKDPMIAAWDAARETGAAASPDPWRPMKDGAGRQIPHVCLKLPTGGGKTLLAAHGLERISVDLFKRTSGLVLWIVPSEAIYTQTKKQLADRENPIRQVLDRLSGGRVKILEKLDGFTRQDLQERLCVLLLMLPSANRETRESLKVFRDSGHYESLFPIADDTDANAALLKDVPNLEISDLGDGFAAGRIKHSLGNVLRIVRPIVILDEGHHAYGELARSTLSTFNPRFILELTATPKREFSNILVNIPGIRLKDEEMIKLPIKLVADKNLAWKTVLQDALKKLNELQKEAEKSQGQTGRYIRPIMLVRVDLTGKEQRHRTGELIHSEDVFEYLTQIAGLPPDAVRRQTAELKELKDDDLLSDTCPVRAIITKDALREGWDCPFAYVLAVLSSGTAKTALTQMIGRVLRQPYATRTGEDALDSAYVFCKDVKVGDAVAHIKSGLEKEGMGDVANQIETKEGGADKTEAEIRIRKKFSGSRIMVPRVLHRDGKKYRELEFESDILPEIDFGVFSYRKAADFPIADYDGAKRAAVDIDFASGEKFALKTGAASIEAAEAEELDRPGLVRRMLNVVPNPWQGMRILDDALDVLRKRKDVTEENILAARYQLIEAMLVDLREQVDASAEDAFRRKVKKGDIVFKLLATPFEEFNFEFHEIAHVRVSEIDTPLLREGFTPLERSLYDKVFKSHLNMLEEGVALYLDDNDAVHWWWRIVSRQGWSLQGWKRNKVYPDFLIKLEAHDDDARMLVLETKGKHLGGSEDTEFKRKLFEVLEAAYAKGVEAGEVELFADRPDAMHFRIMLQEDNWKSDLQSSLS